jgi:hypothetical protein
VSERVQGPTIDKGSLMNEWQTLITEWQYLERALQEQGTKYPAHEQARVADKHRRALQQYRAIIAKMRPVSTRRYFLMGVTGHSAIKSQATLHEARNSWSTATAHWKILQAAWTKIQKAKGGVLTPEQQRSVTLRDIRRSVILGMLETWTAQWLFWAGYVKLAADSYVPRTRLWIGKTNTWAPQLLPAQIGVDCDHLGAVFYCR